MFENVSVNYMWNIKAFGIHLKILFEYLTCVDGVIPLDFTWSWDNIWLLTQSWEQEQCMMCAFVIVLQIPEAFAESKWHLNDRFPARTWAICTCLFSVKANKLERLPPTICLSWLGHNSATGLGHRGAQSLALQEESGPEPFPGGLRWQWCSAHC